MVPLGNSFLVNVDTVLGLKMHWLNSRGQSAGRAKRIDMMGPAGDGECKAPYCEVGTSFFALLTGWVKRQTLFNKFRNRPVLLISVA